MVADICDVVAHVTISSVTRSSYFAKPAKNSGFAVDLFRLIPEHVEILQYTFGNVKVISYVIS